MVQPQVPYSRPARFITGDRHPSWQDAELREDQLSKIAQLIAAGDVFVLTGAGVSTASGIPDYRGPDGVRATTSPMTYQQFSADPAARHRYWARSFFGWPVIAAARPNPVHHEVFRWWQAGVVRSVVTQNVDGLHLAAGVADTVELHGSLHQVICLDCPWRIGRGDYTGLLAAANPGLADATAGEVAPDGDTQLPDDVVARFVTVPCGGCGGSRLKPDVVYFGENVPTDRVAVAYEALDEAASVVVLGSSLTVMSGYRFVRDAARRGLPVAVVTQGVSRGDRHASLRADVDLAAAVATWRQVLPLP